jgi:hypothetical protein
MHMPDVSMGHPYDLISCQCVMKNEVDTRDSFFEKIENSKRNQNKNTFEFLIATRFSSLHSKLEACSTLDMPAVPS